MVATVRTILNSVDYALTRIVQYELTPGIVARHGEDVPQHTVIRGGKWRRPSSSTSPENKKMDRQCGKVTDGGRWQDRNGPESQTRVRFVGIRGKGRLYQFSSRGLLERGKS